MCWWLSLLPLLSATATAIAAVSATVTANSTASATAAATVPAACAATVASCSTFVASTNHNANPATCWRCFFLQFLPLLLPLARHDDCAISHVYLPNFCKTKAAFCNEGKNIPFRGSRILEAYI